ncbi:hypothetical protein PV328_009384 [Microctonus aethiopoides]|uniref:F-box domain-containing protein n=1 Tax=Microctonus aethiopoides TaxID=144406 RepID=A0AA39C6H3_9HYME|nr:hypothetical protein PV328_009384 [Microctonus aethiopoides]
MPPKELQSEECTINILDNDCLIKIFLYLPIKDRMRIEGVCKRWQTVNQEAWSDIKELKFPEALDFLYSYIPNVREDKKAAIKKLLPRCGRFLNKLEFGIEYGSYEFNIIPIIAKYCHNLQSLIVHFEAYDLICLNITWLFLNLHKIERLKLTGLDSNFRDACLIKLPTNTMKELSLEIRASDFDSDTYCVNITRAGAIGIQTLKNLWKLELNGFSFEADELNLIVRNESITYLSFKSCCFENCINLIANFRGLKYLNLSFECAVDDNFLIKLAANCTELEELNIDYCRDVTNNGINAVFKLKKLTTLKSNGLYKVTNFAIDTVLSKYEALKVLHCSNCSVSDYGTIELLQNAPYLEEIDLTSTSISTEFLDVACNVAISRANAKPLRIIANYSSLYNWRRPQGISESVLIVELLQEYDWGCDDELETQYSLDNPCDCFHRDDFDDFGHQC